MPDLPPPGSAIRPFNEQTPLEKVLRARLWHPTDALRRATESLPAHVKRKEYREAAYCQDQIIKATREREAWLYLLELYEMERNPAAVHSEALNDIADVLDMPTGATPAEIVAAVRERCGEAQHTERSNEPQKSHENE